MQNLRLHHKAARRTAILLAARDVVAEGGIDALTMRTLAIRADVSVPTIYNLIGHRAQVLAALFNAGGEQFNERLTASPDDSLVASMVEASDVLASLLVANERVVTAVLQSGGVDGSGGVFEQFRCRVVDILAAGSADEVLEPPVDPQVLADRCSALAAGAVIVWARGHHDDDLLRDEIVHGSLLVVAAHVGDDERARVRRALDRRARRITAARSSATHLGGTPPSVIAQ